MKWIGLWSGLLLVMVSGCANPIVGGECKDGYVACDGRCVRVDDDPMNCGACGNVCSAAQVCRAGVCAGSMMEGGDTDSGDLDAGGGTGGGGMGGGGTGGDGGTGGIVFPPDASFPGCGIGEIECSGACVTPDEDPAHCGDCDTACAVDQFCVDGMCLDACSDPFTFCPSTMRCIDLSIDPKNCGSCGRVCTSGLCDMGMCQDAVPGHLIVIGHDYAASNTTMQRLARSAAFLASGAPVPALTYQGRASAPTVSRINAVIEASLERQWAPEAVIDLAFGTQLNDRTKKYQLLVVYPQAGASDMELRKFRDSHLAKLADFLKRGGVVVVFEHNPSDLNGGMRNAGTHQLLGCRAATTDCTPLFAAESVSLVAADARVLINYEDGWITNGVPGAYAGARNTMRFNGVTTPGNLVATEESTGEPVIVHRLLTASPDP